MIVTGYQLLKSRFTRSNVAKGASFAFIVRVYGAALAYLIQLYLARSMGAEQLGIFVFAWTWMSIISFLTPLGFDTSLVRFLASYSGKKEWKKARGVINLGYSFTLMTSFVAAMIGISFILFTGDLTQPYKNALYIAIASIPVMAMVNLHEGIARGFRWIYQVSMPSFALRPSLFLLLILGVVSIGIPVHSTWVMGAMSSACLLTWGYQYWRYRQILQPEIAHATSHKNTGYWLLTSLPMVLVVSFEQLLANTDIIMLGILESPEATGIYNIAVRIVGITLFVFFAVSAFAGPKIAELYSQNKTAELIQFSNKVRLATALPTLIGLLVLGYIGVPLLNVFGPEFTAAYYPMMVLCIAVVARVIAGPVDNLLIMTGQQNQLAKVLGMVALFNLIANSVLIPIYGTMGAACATTASIVIELAWVSILAGRHIGFRPWLLIAKE